MPRQSRRVTKSTAIPPHHKPASSLSRQPTDGTSRKVTKSTSIPPQHKPANSFSCQPTDGTTSVDYSTLKRTQLQQHCKKLGIRATGKNSELVERLKAFHGEPLLKTVREKEDYKKENEEPGPQPQAPPAAPPVDPTKEIKTEAPEEKTDLVRGWCVVHGMILYRPASSWSPLLLRGGMVYVQHGEKLVPFHLPPLNTPVPDGFSDNYVCVDCVLRNEEKPKRSPLSQHITGKGSRVSLPRIALKNRTSALDSTARSSLLPTSNSRDRRRTIEVRKLYQPQEDQAYAQRVDGLLSQMARGELGMDLALRPLQPLVVHSPAPFER